MIEAPTHPRKLSRMESRISEKDIHTVHTHTYIHRHKYITQGRSNKVTIGKDTTRSGKHPPHLTLNRGNPIDLNFILLYCCILESGQGEPKHYSVRIPDRNPITTNAA
jgi:hypothetical protein